MFVLFSFASTQFELISLYTVTVQTGAVTAIAAIVDLIVYLVDTSGT